MTDPREAAQRYRQARFERELGEEPAEAAASDPERGSSAQERAAFVETSIQQAIRRGEFDDLPGAGKPLPDLGSSHDPDWWIRRKIQAEGLTGLGPPALTLRTEYASLHSRLDEFGTEAEVREHLEDFNRRVIEARRQLLGGPPVVTPTVAVDDEVRLWRERRERPSAQGQPDSPRRTTWVQRWRARRSAGG